MESLVAIDKDSHVLEIGPGRGSFAVRLAKKVGCKVTCVAKSTKQIRQLARDDRVAHLLDTYEIKTTVDDSINALKKTNFDAIICIETLEENPGSDYEKYFNLFSERCREGGRIILQINCGTYDFSKGASDILKVYGFPGTSLPSLGDVYNYGAKNGLIISICARLSEQ